MLRPTAEVYNPTHQSQLMESTPYVKVGRQYHGYQLALDRQANLQYAAYQYAAHQHMLREQRIAANKFANEIERRRVMIQHQYEQARRDYVKRQLYQEELRLQQEANRQFLREQKVKSDRKHAERESLRIAAQQSAAQKTRAEHSALADLKISDNHFARMSTDQVIDLNTNPRIWEVLIDNPHFIEWDLIPFNVNNANIYQRYPEKISWSALRLNPSLIQLMRSEISAIDWSA